MAGNVYKLLSVKRQYLLKHQDTLEGKSLFITRRFLSLMMGISRGLISFLDSAFVSPIKCTFQLFSSREHTFFFSYFNVFRHMCIISSFHLQSSCRVHFWWLSANFVSKWWVNYSRWTTSTTRWEIVQLWENILFWGVEKQTSRLLW